MTKKYVVADVVPDWAKFLTAGKVYEVVGGHGDIAFIIDDEGNNKMIRLYWCAFLDGKPWRLVDVPAPGRLTADERAFLDTAAIAAMGAFYYETDAEMKAAWVSVLAYDIAAAMLTERRKRHS